ncbi:hypothetical protein ADIS_3107 [Lunatimonas lonarensis]|uniref:Uncharacterized protein n=1 Tax=Lunatimonas lonarensis TaxID=1232681 RepID=R7ZRF9_9BACT|nr:hypothetical protein ADIS_3107 [Lunatimonas lonarensis]
MYTYLFFSRHNLSRFIGIFLPEDTNGTEIINTKSVDS